MVGPTLTLLYLGCTQQLVSVVNNSNYSQQTQFANDNIYLVLFALKRKGEKALLQFSDLKKKKIVVEVFLNLKK